MVKIKQITITSLIISLLAIGATLSGIKPAQATIPDVLNTVPNTVNFGEVETCLGASYIKNFYISNVGEEVTASISLIGGRSGFLCSINGGEMTDGLCGETKIMSGGRIGVSIKLTPPPKKTGMSGTMTVKITNYAGSSATKTVSLNATGKCTSIIPVAKSYEVPVPLENCGNALVSINKLCYVEGTKETASCGDACHDFVIQTDLDGMVFWNIYKVSCFKDEVYPGVFRVKWQIAEDVCSIADKLANDGANPLPDPHLRSGSCACGGFGDIDYKICCSIPSSCSVPSSCPSILPKPINATKYSIQDKFLPVEGVCGGEGTTYPYGTVIEPDISKRPATCPLTPFTLTASRLENNSTIAKVTWNAPTADWCGNGNFVTKGAVSGTVETSDIPADNKFFVCCEERYTYGQRNSRFEANVKLCVSAIVGGTDGGGCSTNCERCSNNNLGKWVKWYDPDGKCDSDFYNCQTMSTENDSRCLYYYCSNNQCVSGGVTCPAGQTCYNKGDSTCANKCGGIQPPQDKGADVTIPTFSINNVNKGTACIPQQLGERRDVTISWGATVKNQCVLPASASASPPQGEWKGGWTLVTPNDGDCAAYAGSAGWSGSLGLSGSRSLITSPSATTTYTISCSRPAYDCEWYRNYTYTYDCSYYHVCVTDPLVPEKPKSCGTAATCEQNENTTCEYIQKTCTATDSVEVAGGHFDGSIKSASSTLAVIQPLSSVTITPRLQKENNFFKVIKNISFIIEWFSGAPSSVVRTTISCAPSITYSTSGEYKGWASRGTLAASGNTPKEVSNENDAIYRLTCYNRYNGDPNCYTSKSASAEVKAFGTELEPKAGWLERIRDIFLTTRVNTGLAGGE